MNIKHVTIEQAQLVMVRVPFHKSQRAWKLSSNRVYRIGGRGPLPIGAVDLGEGNYLNINNGVVYRVEVQS